MNCLLLKSIAFTYLYELYYCFKHKKILVIPKTFTFFVKVLGVDETFALMFIVVCLLFS